MRRLKLALSLCAIMATDAAVADPSATPDADQTVWSAACATYRNRARFLSRREPVAFVTLLAEACSGAIGSLDAPGVSERRTAATFLTRLAKFRDTIRTMNVERVYGPGADPASRPVGPIDGVTATGEYLIARQMGVQRALGEWLDTGVAFSLASR